MVTVSVDALRVSDENITIHKYIYPIIWNIEIAIKNNPPVINKPVCTLSLVVFATLLLSFLDVIELGSELFLFFMDLCSLCRAIYFIDKK
jgi:hypothetical protein